MTVELLPDITSCRSTGWPARAVGRHFDDFSRVIRSRVGTENAPFGIIAAVLTRPEVASDHAAITRLHRAAFAGEDEARLVGLLRQAGEIIASLVATDDTNRVVGHILFSRARIVTHTTELLVASLAPMAVEPSHQRQGIGASLVDQGLHACREAGYRASIVVGHPRYYSRFGFSHAVVASLANPFTTDEAFMGLELARGALSDLGEGRIIYPEAFEQL